VGVTGPQGPQGVAGPIGPAGPVGPSGMSLTGVTTSQTGFPPANSGRYSIQTGDSILTTDGLARATLVLPRAFAGGLLNFIATNADDIDAGTLVVSVVRPGNQLYNNQVQLSFSKQGAAAGYGQVYMEGAYNMNVRISWIAFGYD
jgi:hypothetical protein